MPANLQESQKLAEPLFTPSTKAELGDHDENISFEKLANMLGVELATKVRNISLEIYSKGRDSAAERGIIIADTQF